MHKAKNIYFLLIKKKKKKKKKKKRDGPRQVAAQSRVPSPMYWYSSRLWTVKQKNFYTKILFCQEWKFVDFCIFNIISNKSVRLIILQFANVPEFKYPVNFCIR